MLEGEAKGGHRGVFELLHLSDKTSGAGVASLSPREFPLYYGGKELKPFQYALFLLSKVGPPSKALALQCIEALDMGWADRTALMLRGLPPQPPPKSVELT